MSGAGGVDAAVRPTPETLKNLIVNPVALLDELAAKDAGNTPRPSEISNLFLQGMREVTKDAALAEKILLSAAKMANTAVKSAAADATDWERFGMVLMGLGYVCAVRENTTKAADYYNKSFNAWMKMYGGVDPAMLHLMRDLATVQETAQLHKQALNTLKGMAQLIQKSQGIKTADMAETVCRMAILLANSNESGEVVEAYRYFDKAVGCVRKATTTADTEALVHVLSHYKQFLEREKTATSPSMALESIESRLRATNEELQRCS